MSIKTVTAVLFGLAVSMTAHASPTVVISTSPGNPADITCRIALKYLEKKTGINYIIENKAAASTIVATKDVIKAAPDGNTILCTNSIISLIPYTLKAADFDPVKDLVPVSILTKNPLLLITNKNYPTLDSLKVKNTINFGTVGVGGASWLLSKELFKTLGVDGATVPYPGVGNALTEIIAGRLDGMFSPSTVIGEYKDQINIIPYPIDTTIWVGMFLPAGVADSISKSLYQNLEEVKNDPDFQEEMKKLRANVFHHNSQYFIDFLKQELEYNKTLVKNYGVAEKQ